MTPIEQARLRMPPALPMSLAPRDGTPVLVCGVVYREVNMPNDGPTWVVAYWDYQWRIVPYDCYSMWVEAPLGWLPLPMALTAPVEEMPPALPMSLAPRDGTIDQVIELKKRRGELLQKLIDKTLTPDEDRELEEIDKVHDHYEDTMRPLPPLPPAPPTPERHKPLPYPEDSNG